MTLHRLPLFLRLPWPAPALLAWAAAWSLHAAARAAGATPLLAALAATLLGAAAAALVERPLRRLLVTAGFPLSAMAAGWGADMPAWLWLLPVLLGLAAYPLRAWRDAPFFPTAAGSLDGLDRVVSLAPGAQVMDAGCGLGDGLRALRRVWPDARLAGIEWSWPLQLACRLRCPWAEVQRGDMWARSWSGNALVYLFQRPESMPRALAKAQREMAAGSWLVSLEFEVPGLAARARLQGPGQRPVWVYRIDGTTSTRSSITGPDGR